jgi:LSD1 subclass zinc finger protein
VRGSDTEIGPATDVYALAVILYEMVCGRLPFEGLPMSILGKVLNSPPPPPTQFRADLDVQLEAVMLRAMSKKAGERYATAAEFATALKPFAAATTAVPRPAATDAGRSAPQPTPAAARTPREMPTPSGASVVCFQCGKMLRIPAGAEGKRIKCPACQTVIDTAAPPPPPPPRPAERLQAERPELPSRSREDLRRSDDRGSASRSHDYDDEDDYEEREGRRKRPRSIRKRKAASGGNAALIWLSIGGGALVLVGVIVLIIVLSSSDDTKVADPKLDPPGQIGGGQFPPPEVPQGWQTFTSAKGRFRVVLPGNPKEQQQPAPGMTVYMFMLEVPPNGGYAVGYSDLPLTQREIDQQKNSILDGAKNGFFSGARARETRSENITLAGKYSGRALEGNSNVGGLKLKGRMYLVGPRLYQIMVVGQPNWVDGADANRFLNSFAVTQ